MKISVTGIVIFEKKLTENSKYIYILTQNLGIISVLLRKSKNKNNINNLVQVFSYGDFMLYNNKSGYILDDFDVKELFFDLRYNLKNLALAQYFCQLIIVLHPDKEYCYEILRVFLNCLYYLCNQKKDCRIIKIIFELRICSVSGYSPDFSSCEICKKYDMNISYFVIKKSKIFCHNCIKYIKKNKNIKNFSVLNSSSLFCLRHIIYSPVENLFSFLISESIINNLINISESYIKYHVDYDFKALEFYNKI